MTTLEELINTGTPKIDVWTQRPIPRLTQCIKGNSSWNLPGWLIKFDYDADLISDFKASIDITHREWCPDTKEWWVSDGYEEVIASFFDPTRPSYTLPQKQQEIGCLRCNHTGFIPFIKPDGTTSRFARVFCPECHEDDHEYLPVKPSDIDFACSYAWRSHFEEMATGKPLDSIEPRELEPQSPPEQIIVHRTSSMGKQEYDLLQQTARKLEYLEKKLAEHTEYKRKVPVKSGKTMGIKIE